MRLGILKWGLCRVRNQYWIRHFYGKKSKPKVSDQSGLRSQFLSSEGSWLRRFRDVRLKASSDGVRADRGNLPDLRGWQFECLWWSFLSGPHNRIASAWAVVVISLKVPSSCSHGVRLQGKGQLLFLAILREEQENIGSISLESCSQVLEETGRKGNFTES